MPLVKLSQDDLFRLVIPVPESYVRYIALAIPWRCGPGAEQRLSGKVARFSVDVKEDTRTMHTEVDVPNPGRALMPGHVCRSYPDTGKEQRAGRSGTGGQSRERQSIALCCELRPARSKSGRSTLGLQSHQRRRSFVGHGGWRPGGSQRAQRLESRADSASPLSRPVPDSPGAVRQPCLGFSIRNPYFIVVVCLALAVMGVICRARCLSICFPPINLPEVVVATFFCGMPPQDIEIDITNPLERFFTLASGLDHMESRSLLGVSIIKVYFQPGTNADADVTQLSNLALADLKRLPPGTLPPVVLKSDASSLPVCLVTVKGEGLNETQLHDIAQFPSGIRSRW